MREFSQCIPKTPAILLMPETLGLGKRIIYFSKTGLERTGFGAQGFTIRNTEDFEALDIGPLFSAKGPSLLDVYIDLEVIPLMVVWVQELSEMSKPI